jgi:outer membrane protein assembly factor BamB
MPRQTAGRRFHVLVTTLLGLAPVPAVAGGGLLCGSAGDDLVAGRSGLAREWVVQVPFDSSGWRLEHVTVGENMVVACTSDGGVHAVQAARAPGRPRPGSVLWSNRVGRPGGLGQPAGIGPSLVTVAHDLDVHAFDAASGVRRWVCQLGHATAEAAVPAGDDVYCPMTDDGLIRLPADLAGVVAVADAGGQELDTAVPIEQPAVPYAPRQPDLVGAVWVNDEGRLIAQVPTARDGWETWSFDTRVPGEREAVPVGPPAVSGETVYVATRSGRLAAVRPSPSTRGDFEQAWLQPVFLPGVPESGPVVVGDRVIVSLGDEGLVACSARPDDINSRRREPNEADAPADPAAAAAADKPAAAAGGEILWRTPCGIGGRLVAVVGERVWFVDKVNRLASVDLATGEPREWMPLGDFTLPVINPRGGRLVLASPDGLLVSLVPRRTASALPTPAAGGVPTPGDAVDEAHAGEGTDAEPPAEEASRT